MADILVVVDMQNDFITGALGSAEAQAVLPALAQAAQRFPGQEVFTRDTHGPDYLNTQEGKNLPVVHCVKGTEGWQLAEPLRRLAEQRGCPVFDKPAFGSTELVRWLERQNQREPLGRVVLAGVCTDICVISNALCIKAALPEVPVAVESGLCAGVTPAGHENALRAMQACQVEVR